MSDSSYQSYNICLISISYVSMHICNCLVLLRIRAVSMMKCSILLSVLWSLTGSFIMNVDIVPFGVFYSDTAHVGPGSTIGTTTLTYHKTSSFATAFQPYKNTHILKKRWNPNGNPNKNLNKNLNKEEYKEDYKGEYKGSSFLSTMMSSSSQSQPTSQLSQGAVLVTGGCGYIGR